MRTTPVPEKELNDAKRAIVASFALSLENPEQLLGYYVQNWMYNLPADYWDTYPAKISAVTAAQAQAAAVEVLGSSKAADRCGRGCRQDHRDDEEERTAGDLRRRRQAGERLLTRPGLSPVPFAAICSIAAAKISISSTVVYTFGVILAPSYSAWTIGVAMIRHRSHRRATSFRRRHACDLYGANRARMSRVEVRVEADLRVLREALGPAVAQVPQPCGLSFDADALVKRHRFSDGVVIRGGMCPYLLELADVVGLRFGCRRQRPERSDVLAANIEKAGADWREQPLVEARAVVVAAEVACLEGKVCERVRPIHDGLDSTFPRLVADALHGKDLPREVGDVAEVQDLCCRRQRGNQRGLTARSATAGGTGNEIFVSLIPSRRTRCSHVSSMRP